MPPRPSLSRTAPLLMVAATGCGREALPPVVCPEVPGASVLRVEVTREQLLQDRIDFAAQDMRPVSVSATGSGEDARFDVLWVRDRFGLPGRWQLHVDVTEDELDTLQFGTPGFRPLALDAYGPEPRFLVAMVRDFQEARMGHFQSAGLLREADDEWAAEGFSPVWVDGLDAPPLVRYTAIWVQDSVPRAMDLDLAPPEEDVAPWRARADGGWRALRISTYQRSGLSGSVGGGPTPLRAAVWQQDPPGCGAGPWKGVDGEDRGQLGLTLAAQAPRGPSATVESGSGTLALPGPGLPVRLTLQGPISGSETLLRAIAAPGAQPGDGHLLVLEPRADHRIVVSDDALGNIRLRPWFAGAELDPEGLAQGCARPGVQCRGQTMRLTDYDSRLFLRYDASDDSWHEVRRNEVAPDRYFLLSLDAVDGVNGRRLASVWGGHPPERRFLVNSALAEATLNAAPGPQANLNDTLATRFDAEMQQWMQDRMIPSAIVALVADGRLVLSRGYAYAPPEWAPFLLPDPQTALFRAASLAKPLTAIGVMRLVSEGTLQLGMSLRDIFSGIDPDRPEFMGNGHGWDERVPSITVRQLLGHLGGWDRDRSTDFTVGQDFAACRQLGLDALPVEMDDLIDFARSRPVGSGSDVEPRPLDHQPGDRHAYSNFGYTLLGRVIEEVTGATYEAWLRETLFNPIGATSTFLAPPGPGGELGREVRYFTPESATAPARFGFGSGPHHPLRDPCDPAHADRLPAPYGGRNVRNMDAHGGWLSTAPDLARILVALDDSTLLPAALRDEMLQRQPGRELRVVTVEQGGATVEDRSFDARFPQATVPGSAPIALLPSAGAQLHVGRGLRTFGQVGLNLAAAGQGYDLRVEYSSPGGWTLLTADEHGLVDDGEGFSQTDTAGVARITFTPPEDWVALPSPAPGSSDLYYWIRISSAVAPSVTASADSVNAGVEEDYGLGWEVRGTAGYRHDILLDFFDPGVLGAPPPAGVRVVGARSQASAVLLSMAAVPGGQLLSVNGLTGGSFRPGENLLVGDMQGAILGRLGPRRERTVFVSAAHGGALTGLLTRMKRRADGLHWVVMVNQRETDRSFHARSHAPVEGRIDGIVSLADSLVTAGAAWSWPTWDLFP
jgi:CubicO group peptidase (beta-lactamase class C family)